MPHPDERSPLLRDHHVPPPKSRRGRRSVPPLVKAQLAIVLLLQICEPICSMSILPYINQLIIELDITGGNDKKVGYYAGLIESLFFATEALTVLQWGRASDHIGRKPILLIGLLGSALSTLAFGLSRSLCALVVSRCLTGLLNGNIGVMKSVMGELTDSSNRAEIFALMPIAWGFGATIGPFIGGSLSHPYERFPSLFGNKFWKEYPYFLPCFVAASYSIFGFLITLFFFKETVQKNDNNDIYDPINDDDSNNCNNLKDSSKPLPLRKILTYPVILSISNYASLAFLNIGICALYPLFLAMPLPIGGLSLSPPTIGLLIGCCGIGTALVQGLFFSRVVRCFGPRRAFIGSISCLVPISCLFPLINRSAVGFGKESCVVWTLIFILSVNLACVDMAYGTVFMYITASAPSKRSLGATNGLAQTTVSIARAIGPAFATSMFSFTVQHNILGGFGVYAVFLSLSMGALYLASHLPPKVWDDDED